MKLDKYLTESMWNEAIKIQKYPELDKLAKNMAYDFLKDINSKTRNIKSEMPYKAQYVLEEIIKILKEAV